MTKITMAEFLEKELGWAMQAELDLRNASREARSARRLLGKMGQHTAELHATHVWAESEKALEETRTLVKDRRRQLRLAGKKLCRCGIVLGEVRCDECGGKGKVKRARCWNCHGTGRLGSRIHKGD